MNMDLLDNKENIEIIIDCLKKSRDYYKNRLKEENKVYDEFLSDKIYRIDKLLEELDYISLDFIY